jgi:hypothetical protein
MAADSFFKQQPSFQMSLPRPACGRGKPNSIFKQQDRHCEPAGRANARSTYSVVIRGLDPRIHLLKGISRSGWIAGSSPAMTATSGRDERSLAPFAGIHKHAFAISPHVLREVCHHHRPSQFRGRRECRAPDAPESRVCNDSGRTHTRSQVTPESPGIPHAMVYGLCRALPGDRLSCHRRRRSCLHRLDTSVGVSGPHVFAVRLKHPRQEHHPRPPHPAPRW